MTGVRARVLGGFKLSIDGRQIERADFERPSGLRLLKLLLATPGHAVRREEAAELLWPEAEPERSAANLRKALHFARQALDSAAAPPDLLTTDGDALRIGGPAGRRAGGGLDVDVDALRNAVDSVRAAAGTAAPQIGTGELELLASVAGEELLPEDPYEEWLVPLRERLRQQTLGALVDAGRIARTTGRGGIARRLAERALALEPAEEAAHRLAIELHIDAGELHAARRQLVECARALAEAYGVEPSPDLVALVAAAAATRRQVSAAAPEQPIIGRRQELEAADPALDDVQVGRLGAVVYVGSAGMGKTRLLREVERLSVASGWLVAEVRGLESSLDLAFASLGSGLATALGDTLPTDLDEPGRSALLTIAPRFGERADLSFATDAALVAGLVDAVRALASRRPLVVSIDDVQWLDAASIELLRAIVGRLRDAPILIGATVRDRPAAIPPAVAALLSEIERGGGAVVRLGPMAPREIRLVLERDLHDGRLDDGLADEIAARVAGAPLFALEVLRAAIEAGIVGRRGDAWQRLDSNASLPVPRGVTRLVESRTAELPADVRDILATAAELGDEVGLEVLAAATSGQATDPDAQGERSLLDESPVLSALDAAISGGLMVERGGRYAFAHPLFRAALRSSVLPGARASLHLRVARALAGDARPDDPSSIDRASAAGLDVVAIAGHAQAAAGHGLAAAIPLAVGFGFSAGARQAGLFDHAAAIETLNRAIALWDRMPAADRHRYRAAGAFMQLGWSRHAIRDEIGASGAFRRAAEAATSDAERAAAWQAAAWMPYEHGRFDTADALLATALEEVHDPVARAGIESDRAWIIGRKGDWAAAYEMLAPAVAAMEGAAPAPLLARSLDRLGVAMRDSMDAAAAVPVLERGLRLATEIGDARLAATIRMHLAGAFRVLRRFDAAGEQIDVALRTCAMTGDRYIEAVTVWIAADIAHAEGDLRNALELRRRELDLLEGLGGNEHNQAMAHAHLSFLARRLDDPATADAEAELARNIARHSGLAHLPARIEQALASPGWFIEDPPAQGRVRAADPRTGVPSPE